MTRNLRHSPLGNVCLCRLLIPDWSRTVIRISAAWALGASAAIIRLVASKKYFVIRPMIAAVARLCNPPNGGLTPLRRADRSLRAGKGARSQAGLSEAGAILFEALSFLA
jgi:hypothetical protein